MSTNTERLQKRIEARRWAEDCYEAVEDKTAFVQRVMELGGKVETKPPKIVPMTDEECRRFEKRTIPFGAYKGEQIAYVPLTYLCRLTDPSKDMEAFLDEIRRYLKNPSTQQSIADEDE